LEKNSPSKQNSVKANALLCPVCCVEYVEIEIDFEVDGVILRNIKALRCPTCEDEAFTPEQLEAVRNKLSS